MYRSLRFQLIVIVVGTVATVLAASQWLDTNLSERALERNLKERVFRALNTVNSLWGSPELASTVSHLVQANPELLAVDVFRLDGTALEPAVTTRDGGLGAVALSATERTLLASGTVATERLPSPDGGSLWRVSEPLRRGGSMVGVARADLSLAEVASLQRGLRTIDGVFLILSIALISIPLGLFLERRVGRPVAALVTGMQQAESGALDARVSLSGGGEFAFVARSFNRMLGRIEELTADLESRVRRATHDLAERNRELEEANGKLWHAQLEIARTERFAALGQFAGTIAHELGTPLNSVLGYTQLLLREDLPHAQTEKLTIVESQIQRMIETIRGVLDRMRDRAPRRAPVQIEAIVAEALTLVSTRVAGRDIVIRNDVRGGLPPVPGDAIGLRQVMLNLLTNAIDATEASGTITVSATCAPDNGRTPRWLEIAVRDNGHGMSPAEARQVFEPFYTTKAPGRGTGLGLAIVDHVVRAHGGEMVLESAPGKGTTMRVRLPLEAS